MNENRVKRNKLLGERVIRGLESRKERHMLQSMITFLFLQRKS